MALWIALILIGASRVNGQVSAEKLKKFAPLPEVMELASNARSGEKVDLGRMLYFDPRFSRSGKISCNTCHPLDRFGMDGTPVSTGHEGLKGKRNAPSVYNAAGHQMQFWDGRAVDVEEQAKGPVLNTVEMAMPSAEAVVTIIGTIPGYRTAFAKAFPGDARAVSYDNFGRAIAAFERGLVTPSRWDLYLKGDKQALTHEEQKGFTKFIAAGCGDCHSGSYLGGQDYKVLGVEKPWPALTDTGRFAVTHAPQDRFVFKIPSLRNVDKTGPYLHDGSIQTLEECVRLMAIHQAGRKLNGSDVNLIVTWLRTLTGVLPADYIRPPSLPERAPGE